MPYQPYRSEKMLNGYRQERTPASERMPESNAAHESMGMLQKYKKDLEELQNRVQNKHSFGIYDSVTRNDYNNIGNILKALANGHSPNDLKELLGKVYLADMIKLYCKGVAGLELQLNSFMQEVERLYTPPKVNPMYNSPKELYLDREGRVVLEFISSSVSRNVYEKFSGSLQSIICNIVWDGSKLRIGKIGTKGNNGVYTTHDGRVAIQFKTPQDRKDFIELCGLDVTLYTIKEGQDSTLFCSTNFLDPSQPQRHFKVQKATPEEVAAAEAAEKVLEAAYAAEAKAWRTRKQAESRAGREALPVQEPSRCYGVLGNVAKGGALLFAASAISKVASTYLELSEDKERGVIAAAVTMVAIMASIIYCCCKNRTTELDVGAREMSR